jgi:hypothetical protein
MCLHDLLAAQAPRRAIGISPDVCGKAIERVDVSLGDGAAREFKTEAVPESAGGASSGEFVATVA